MSISKRLIALIFSAFFSSLNAAELPELLKEAEEKGLHKHTTWLGLLAYRGHDASSRSEIISEDFFLAENGSVDPESELVATLTAYFDTADIIDSSAHCKFPARYYWLSQHISDLSLEPLTRCEGLANWRSEVPDSVELVFAAGYLSNPASYYGHMLLKFSSVGGDKTALEESAVNFGAVIPDNEHMIPYIVKGLFGGYKASFSTKEYFNFEHLYSELDLRDIWKYKLKVDESQLTLLHYHLWEILGKRYTYYFVRENCALRYAYLLETIFNTDIVSQLPPYVIPSELLRILEKDGRYVDSVALAPSRQRDFYNKYHQLRPEERQYLLQTIDTGNFDSTLAPPQVAKTMEVAFDYYEYRSAKKRIGDDFKQYKRQALLTRLKNQYDFDWKQPQSGGPHEGDNASLVRLSYVHADNTNMVRLTTRPAYYDRLSNPASNAEFATLTMLELSLLGVDGELRLDHLNFVDIVSLNAPQTPLAKDGGLAWRMKFSAGRFNNSCISCTSVNFTGGAGRAYQGQNFAVSALLNTSLFSDYEGSGVLSFEPELSVMYRPKDRLRVAADVSERFFPKSGRSHPVYRLESSLDLGPSWDVRLGFEKEVSKEFSFGVSYNW